MATRLTFDLDAPNADVLAKIATLFRTGAADCHQTDPETAAALRRCASKIAAGLRVRAELQGRAPRTSATTSTHAHD